MTKSQAGPSGCHGDTARPLSNTLPARVGRFVKTDLAWTLWDGPLGLRRELAHDIASPRAVTYRLTTQGVGRATRQRATSLSDPAPVSAVLAGPHRSAGI